MITPLSRSRNGMILYIGCLISVVFSFSAGLVFADSSTSQDYIEILEKTNQQLSLGWTPINIIVGILTFLVAILTIGLTVGFAFISYRQGREYQQKIDDSLKKSREYFEKIVQERNQKAKEIEEKFSSIISKYEAKLKELLKTPEEQKKQIDEIEKSIQQLKTEKELLSAQTGSISVTPEYNDYSPLTGSSYLASRPRYHKCSQCGFGFNVNDDCSRFGLQYPFLSTLHVNSGATVTCPKCGNIDKL